MCIKNYLIQVKYEVVKEKNAQCAENCFQQILKKKKKNKFWNDFTLVVK